jgi:hypothetical protein
MIHKHCSILLSQTIFMMLKISFFLFYRLFGLYLGVVYIVSMVSRSILGINVERLIFTDMLNVDCALKVAIPYNHAVYNFCNPGCSVSMNCK